jgi:hypothetical protein
MSDETAPEAIEAEAADSNVKTFEFGGETFKMKRKFKRLKFLRQLSSDPGGALSLAFPEDELERLEDLELDEEGLTEVMEAIGKSLTGGSGK